VANIEYTRSFDGAGAGREFVQFSEEAKQNPGKSEAAGLPIFDSVEMVEISFPGNNLTVISREATADDKQKYAKQYEAFKKNGGTVLDGTPLEAWTAMSKALARTFQAMNIFTVQQLAALDDHGIQRLGMGGRMWTERAKVFLEAAEDNGAVDRIAAENFRLKEQAEAMAKQLAELGSLCQGLQAQMQGMQNARADEGRPIMGLPHVVTAPVPVSPVLASGILADPKENYIEPKRRPGRPKAAA
jgi:hypothetical protein